MSSPNPDFTGAIRKESTEKSARRVKLSEFENKISSKFMDPCALESKASMQCLDQSNYDKDACSDVFAAYKECKRLWISERRKARSGGS
ncbi:Mitochondrial copper homeostasis protein [Coemansia sp. RSA 1813]|nr:Mitochondrial copper homeostasis protein [Coemansia sp. RSA 1646]KAJ1770317.1 Mitochondrial copper homeostasis protein [Coemansia sp. RSA 1843]KAJ2091668.1 Mitochondrial copper homeostasis protein [Coemansia sp. RSA 986]KAJ2216930.1 Mitochondrial copper homeostasis protein [Coemansia sp. RSA 487]KAJ2571933.1 Mitochondrial copper homeostasis protein [Coemansia sp. RSA 1813]